ncbi:MAG: hypothetical protein KatS3mg108_2205 [Isosphaeraceae bacterium]|jgi:hypothetical protein|nr:MAG: hypothetical protein KatS3mg108_2205 [Isosphaeraceae bacterium]
MVGMRILEGLVTTVDAQGRLNVAPMGPEVEDADLGRFVLKPFLGSTTLANLRTTGVGVFHVTDDALMLARAALGLETEPATRPAEVICGRILLGACRYREFRVVSDDRGEPRPRLEVEAVAGGTLRDFFGWNRAQHAVVEAAILATRVGIVPWPRLLSELEALRPLVEKTGGRDERVAYSLLVEHVRAAYGATQDRGGTT